MTRAHVDPPVVGEKTCTRCRQTFHVLAFAVDKRTADGLHCHCRECHSAANHAIYRRKARQRPKPFESFDPYGDNDPL